MAYRHKVGKAKDVQWSRIEYLHRSSKLIASKQVFNKILFNFVCLFLFCGFLLKKLKEFREKLGVD
jgi:hypothetical protein